jgi:hypothetical protein
LEGGEGDHDVVFFGFFCLVDDRFAGFALDSRSLSVAAGVRTLDAGDSALIGLEELGTVGFNAAGLVVEVEAVPLG